MRDGDVLLESQDYRSRTHSSSFLGAISTDCSHWSQIRSVGVGGRVSREIQKHNFIYGFSMFLLVATWRDVLSEQLSDLCVYTRNDALCQTALLSPFTVEAKQIFLFFLSLVCLLETLSSFKKRKDDSLHQCVSLSCYGSGWRLKTGMEFNCFTQMSQH